MHHLLGVTRRHNKILFSTSHHQVTAAAATARSSQHPSKRLYSYVGQRRDLSTRFRRHPYAVATKESMMASAETRPMRSSQLYFSAQANTAGNTATTAATAASTKKKASSPVSDAFFDNLGKIFLGTIAAIVGTLIRSSYNTSNRNAVRDQLEEASVLDPLELEELRLANAELTPAVMREILQEVRQHTGSTDSMTYHEFNAIVRRTMVRLKGEAFTIQLGHLLDRIVVRILEDQEKSATEDSMPILLWMTVLSMAMNSSVPDRIRILFELMDALSSTVSGVNDHDAITTDGAAASLFESTPSRTSQESTSADDRSSSSKRTIPFQLIEDMVGYLQDTCQLPTDTQVVPTDQKYPTQQWRQGTPQELVPWEGTQQDPMDCNAFATILRSRSVCAWGECYHKRVFRSVDE